MQHNDEPDHWADLKRKEVEYEKKRLKKQQYYESVKHAQSVQIDEIPLPSSAQASTPSGAGGSANGLPGFPGSTKRLPPPPTALSLPPFAPGAPPGALKNSNDIGSKQQEAINEVETKKKEPLGVPIGPSPDLLEMSDLDTDAEDNEVVLKKYVSKSKSNKIVPKPNSLQQRMLAISGQNIDDFMKEMENVHKKKELERSSGKTEAADSATKDIVLEKAKHSDESDSEESSNSENEDSDPVQKRAKKEVKAVKPVATAAAVQPAAAAAAQTQPPPMAIAIPPAHYSMGGLAPPPPIMFRPPPRPPAMHGFGIRMPPGPPPGPRSMGMPRMRMPGPPPGLPPRMAQHHKNLNNKDNTKGVTTITAKPQIRYLRLSNMPLLRKLINYFVDSRNLSADVTRFVPSTLRVKREETARKPNKSKSYASEGQQQIETSTNAASKDDAYMQFMNEMQGLL